MCDICGGLCETNTKLIGDYLDREIAFTEIRVVKDTDDQITSYLVITLEIEEEGKADEADTESIIVILPCTCGGGKPKYIMEQGEYVIPHVFTCETCNRYVGGTSITDAAIKWNRRMEAEK